MILNVIRTISQIAGYFSRIRYPKTRFLVYSIVSLAVGIALSNSPRASDLPILTLTAILFGFTINAVVMLGNSSEHYLNNEIEHSDQLEYFYKKSLYISIHTLGVGIVTIILTGVFQLFPDVDLNLLELQAQGFSISVELVSTAAYTLTVYYLIVFSIVIASAAELVKFRL